MGDQEYQAGAPQSSHPPQPIEELAQAMRQQQHHHPVPVEARVTLRRTDSTLTEDHAFWAAIRNRTDAIGFERYDRFINRVLCRVNEEDNEDCDKGHPASCDHTHLTAEDLGSPPLKERRRDLLKVPTIYGVDSYNLLKLATQAFLLFEAGIAVKRPRDPHTGEPLGSQNDFVPGEEERIGERVTYEQLKIQLEAYLAPSGHKLPYLKRIVDALVGLDRERQQERLPFCFDLLRHRFTVPSLLELIWSYWNEEGMLVQTINAICLRFQNRRGHGERDPLANLEIDPLRPLNNILWGFIQDENNRLSIIRRVYEYDHHYGLRLEGKAVRDLRPADSRSKFIEAFHNLLYRAALFYREDSDTTVIADGFPLLNSLREVHLLLAEGAHNQFGDLPWTSRAEMLIMQWILARPEMRDFLRGRAMVPYQERWMGQVDTMKRLQCWTDTSITHFRNLAVFGEQILLSVRYGDWIDINDQDFAKTWARYWRPELQNYIHAYNAATGVDLSEEIVDTRRAASRYSQPSVLLRNRLASQDARAELPPAAGSGSLTAGGGGSISALPAPRRRALNPSRNNK